MPLFAGGSDEYLLYVALFLVGVYGLIHLLHPRFMLEWKRLWMGVCGAQPVEEHFFCSTGWMRFVGLILVGIALYAGLASYPGEFAERRLDTTVVEPIHTIGSVDQEGQERDLPVSPH